MKRIIIATLGILLALPTMAQYGQPRPYGGSRYGYARQTRPSYEHRHSSTDIYYGLRIGLELATVNSDDRYLDGGSVRPGFNVGVVVGMQIAPSAPVYFETGLAYTEKGGKGSYNGSKFTYDLDYLQVPLLLKYDYRADRMLSIQPFIGGYLAAGVGGRIKDFGNRQAYSSFDDDGFKRFDGGIKVGCGLQYSHLYAELGYDFGLSNISHDYFDTSHTGAFFATVGVNF